MNLLERWFFGFFLLMSKVRDEQEFTGFNSLLAVGVSIWFNIGTIVIPLITFNLLEIRFPDYLDSRLSWFGVALCWFTLLGVVFLRRKSIRKYRDKLSSIEDYERLRIRSKALFYLVGSVLTFFLIVVVSI